MCYHGNKVSEQKQVYNNHKNVTEQGKDQAMFIKLSRLLENSYVGPPMPNLF